jgi:hypothetical protein
MMKLLQSPNQAFKVNLARPAALVLHNHRNLARSPSNLARSPSRAPLFSLNA